MYPGLIVFKPPPCWYMLPLSAARSVVDPSAASEKPKGPRSAKGDGSSKSSKSPKSTKGKAPKVPKVKKPSGKKKALRGLSPQTVSPVNSPFLD